jgi:hypothetical protein
MRMGAPTTDAEAGLAGSMAPAGAWASGIARRLDLDEKHVI